MEAKPLREAKSGRGSYDCPSWALKGMWWQAGPSCRCVACAVCVQSATLRRALCLLQCSVEAILKLSIIFDKGPTFSFCTESCKWFLVAGRTDDQDQSSHPRSPAYALGYSGPVPSLSSEPQFPYL